MSTKDFIQTQIEAAYKRIDSIGGETEPFVIAPPATIESLSNLERELDSPIPPGLRNFALEVSGRVFFDWQMPDDYELPDEFDEIFCGGFDFDISKLPDHENGRLSWQRECFPDPSDSYDAIWHNKFAFHHVQNGDYIALDEQGKVVYLSHDDGEGHGRVMADSFSDLITRWFPLGCPGPEDWQWLPFASSPKSKINSDSPAATRWLQVFPD